MSGILQQHQALLDAGQFMIQRCGACTKHVYFPREVCPHCGSVELSFVAPTGWGEVYAVTTVRRKPEAGGDYNVCLVDLEEGVRLMSRVDGIAPGAEPEIGLKVKARVVLNEGKGVVIFAANQA